MLLACGIASTREYYNMNSSHRQQAVRIFAVPSQQHSLSPHEPVLYQMLVALLKTVAGREWCVCIKHQAGEHAAQDRPTLQTTYDCY